MEYMYQVRALKRWEFDKRSESEWYTAIDNLEIVWDTKKQFGAYIIDGEISLIHNWDMLDEVMQQTVMY